MIFNKFQKNIKVVTNKNKSKKSQKFKKKWKFWKIENKIQKNASKFPKNF